MAGSMIAPSRVFDPSQRVERIGDYRRADHDEAYIRTSVQDIRRTTQAKTGSAIARVQASTQSG